MSQTEKADGKPDDGDIVARLHKGGFDNKPFSLIVELNFKPGALDRILPLAHAAVAGTHKEPNNIRYDFVRDIDNPNTCYFLEKFKNTKAMEDHVAGEYTQKLLTAFGPELAKPLKVTILEQLSAERD
jgi:quinol monooxygenase YgiN